MTLSAVFSMLSGVTQSVVFNRWDEQLSKYHHCQYHCAEAGVEEVLPQRKPLLEPFLLISLYRKMLPMKWTVIQGRELF